MVGDGISSNDVKRLKEAGIHSAEALAMTTKKSLMEIQVQSFTNIK